MIKKKRRNKNETFFLPRELLNLISELNRGARNLSFLKLLLASYKSSLSNSFHLVQLLPTIINIFPGVTQRRELDRNSVIMNFRR